MLIAGAPPACRGAPMSRRIAIVDDYPFMRDLLSEILKRANYDVVGTAASAAELMEGFAQWRAEVVVLDIMLPDGNGVDVTKQLLARDSKLKVLVISGLDEDTKPTHECIAAGAKGFLGKPFSSESLLKALEKL